MSMQNGGVGLSGKGMGLTGIGPNSGKNIPESNPDLYLSLGRSVHMECDY